MVPELACWIAEAAVLHSVWVNGDAPQGQVLVLASFSEKESPVVKGTAMTATRFMSTT